MEDREKGPGENRACNEDGRWKNGKSSGPRMGGTAGEVGQSEGKQEKDGFVLEEAPPP